MENKNPKNQDNELEEKENTNETESLRITNKYVKKVIYLFKLLLFYFREEK